MGGKTCLRIAHYGVAFGGIAFSGYTADLSCSSGSIFVNQQSIFDTAASIAALPELPGTARRTTIKQLRPRGRSGWSLIQARAVQSGSPGDFSACSSVRAMK
jgi:hypothetical protein